ncbi:MAG: glycerol kinase GlpK [Fibrobacterales bacterium]
MTQYIIALDQGTTSSRAVLFTDTLDLVDICQEEFPQYFPHDGWVEHDPDEIWQSQYRVLLQLIKQNNLLPSQIITIGITNQRETTIVWDRTTGAPIYNAIVWQDRRTAPLCEKLKQQGLATTIQEKTGLVIDAYFSATKLKWLLEEVPGAHDKALKGDLLFGTVDSWLIWKLTNGAHHATDATNACRTMLFNISEMCWDKDLCNTLSIPIAMLPEVRNSSDSFGEWMLDGVAIPISGVAGDQQAATFGQRCFEKGMVKNTYGTGCFMVMNTGSERVTSTQGLLTTIAWILDGKPTYALEGSVFVAGAAIQWLRDGLNLFSNAKDSEALAHHAKSDDQVVVVPAFTGLGAPYWDMYARGAIFGLTRDTGIAEITRATLESIAFQSYDILNCMQKDSETTIPIMAADGGAAANNFLMQFQADLLGIPVERPSITESTALGAATLAGLHHSLWTMDELKSKQIEKTFTPSIDTEYRARLIRNWNNAIQRVLSTPHQSDEE